MPFRPSLTENDIALLKRRTLVRIVDDDSELRDALQFLLEVEGWRVAAYDRAEDFLTSDAPSVPGCVVLDVRMPSMSGLEAQERMNRLGIRLPIVFLTGHGDVDMAVSAMLDGAADFILKPIDNERLLGSIARAAYRSLSASDGPPPPAEARRRLETLTEREAEVAKLLAQKLANREVAERLEIALRTAETHRASVLRKLGVRRPDEIAALFEAAQETQAP